ncbi:DUF4863 family protein [Castellaniella sp.]|uniref:4-hydroxylaminobenzoate lyase n=1 Tax=Castellaniella sp. TaxID=1955812 RepID=UPI003C790F53
MKTQQENTDREALIAHSAAFLETVQGMTPGPDTEIWLNRQHGPDSDLYRTLAQLVKKGVRDGWAANIEVDGPRYRRSLIAAPEERTRYFSITAVYMAANDHAADPREQTYRGQYHAHPYGEFNMIVPLDQNAALKGPEGWCHAGWTAPAPGSEHYPEATGGALIALFYLPAGRIRYCPAPTDPHGNASRI